MAGTTERDNDSKLPDVLGYVAQAWDFAWAFRLACIALFADIWLNRRVGSGLLDWVSPSPDTWWRAGGELLACALAFVLTVSLILQFIALFAKWIAHLLAAWLPQLSEAPRYLGESDGYVLAEELCDFAHHHKDAMALQVVSDHLWYYEAGRMHSATVASLAFCVLALSIADSPWFLPLAAHSLVGVIHSWGQLGSLILYLSWIGEMALVWSVWMAPSGSGPSSVRYWPAAEDLAKRRCEATNPAG